MPLEAAWQHAGGASGAAMGPAAQSPDDNRDPNKVCPHWNRVSREPHWFRACTRGSVPPAKCRMLTQSMGRKPPQMAVLDKLQKKDELSKKLKSEMKALDDSGCMLSSALSVLDLGIWLFLTLLRSRLCRHPKTGNTGCRGIKGD